MNKAPVVKNAPRFNVSDPSALQADPHGKYIEWKHVEKRMTAESHALLSAAARVKELTRENEALKRQIAELEAAAAEIEQFKSAYANDREIMANNVAELSSREARIAELEAEIKTWQSNDRRQRQAIELLKKDAERVGDLEKDFAEIQQIMGCNHEDMHRCVSTMEQELAETKAELARVKAKSLRVVPVGEPCKLQDCEPCHLFALHEGKVVVTSYNEFDDPQAETADSFIGARSIIQPVRLERWQAE